jgi:hypothetical protein
MAAWSISLCFCSITFVCSIRVVGFTVYYIPRGRCCYTLTALRCRHLARCMSVVARGGWRNCRLRENGIIDYCVRCTPVVVSAKSKSSVMPL